MGNCCGKPEPESFRSPGRVLGSAPPKQTTAPVPSGAAAAAAASRQKPTAKVGGPPRTLGGEGTTGPSSSVSPEDARRKAAEAAEARAKGKQVGKLGSQLEAQKKKTMNDTLKESSDENRRQRDIDTQAQTLSHN